MEFPIKYIENNLIKNSNDEWFAYYRLIPYNYSFIGLNQKIQMFYKLRQLFGQTQKGSIHLLCIAVEENMRIAQERSKNYIVGNLSDKAIKEIDRTTDVIVNGEWFEQPKGDHDIPAFVGETQCDYAFYIGFKLVPLENSGIGFILKDTINFWKDYFGNLNHSVMGDYVTVSKDEINRYLNLEDLVFSRIKGVVNAERVKPKDIGYIIEHIYGMNGIAFDDYNFNYDIENHPEYKKIKSYDLLKLSNIQINESPKYLEYISDDKTTFCCYLCLSELLDDLEYPGCEILYYQQQQFDFPVDVSIKLDIIDNKSAVKKLKSKKKNLRDMDNHAWQSGNEADGAVYGANVDADELETMLKETKDVMLKMSFLIRITAETKDKLNHYMQEVKDYYDAFNIKLVCPSGDMIPFHYEFLPGSKIYNVIKSDITCDFVSSLGFGVNDNICEKSGIPIGYIRDSLKFFYMQPWLASQGVDGAVTNSLSMYFGGSLGWGKSFASNLLLCWSVLFGASAVIIDPKSERGNWKNSLPMLADEIHIINLKSNEANRGILDPFIIMSSVQEAESLALDVLTFLMGVSIRDSEKYPCLKNAIKKVSISNKRGLLCVIDELLKMNTEVSVSLANHLSGFVDTGLAQLLFSDGTSNQSITFDKRLNIIQIADLILPDKDKNFEEYTPTEMLSVAMMIVVSTYCINFIHSDNDLFKIVDIDESWVLLNFGQGKTLTNKLMREGRAMHAGCWLSTQSAKDVSDEAIKNNIGMFFIFHSEDEAEIENSLRLLGLDETDEGNKKIVSSLRKGECLVKDIYGRINIVRIDPLLPEFKHAFDTTPKNVNAGDKRYGYDKK